MKICSKCKIEKELSEFNKSKANRDKLNGRCKECIKKYRKEYYLKNKEKIIEKHNIYNNNNKDKIKEYNVHNKEHNKQYMKEYRFINRERIKISKKNYNDNHKEQIKVQQKIRNDRYYNINREKAIEYQKKYNVDNWDKVNERHKEWVDNHPENRTKAIKKYQKSERGRLQAIKDMHKRRIRTLKVDNNTITADFLQQLANNTKYCIFTGVELTAENRHLDHIIPLSRGGKHSADNVRFISDKANKMKGNKLDEEFKLYLCKKHIKEASVIHNEIMKAS